MAAPRRAAAVMAVFAAWVGIFYVLGGAIHDPEGDARDRLVDAARPVGVVLGNSITRTDLDPVALSAALPGQPSVVLLTIDGSGPSTWSALFQEHILARGHQPRWVLVVTDPAYAVGMAPEQAHGVVHRRARSLPERITAGRDRTRREALRSWTGAVASLIGGAVGTTPARASATLSGALHHWLEDPTRLREDAVPLPAGTPELGAWHELAGVVVGSGGQLFVVEAPQRTPPPLRARLAFRELAEVVPVVYEADAAAWIDSTHLGPDAQRHFTQAVAAALADRLP